MNQKSIFILGLIILKLSIALGQNMTTIHGKVADGHTADAVPFVNVMFAGTGIGVVTDFDGQFTISTTKDVDSLSISYIGYKTVVKAVQKGSTQTINIQLFPDNKMMDEVVVFANAENPAWEIIRNTVKRRKKNNGIKNIEACEYEKYTRIELDIDNISEKFRKKKIVKQILSVIDSSKQAKGDDGLPVLPVYVSESVSKVWKRNNPNKTHEKLIKNKAEGVGLRENNSIETLINMIFIDYDFYQSWMSVGRKDFVSPIAASWRNFYHYELDDNMYDVEGEECHKIRFRPKRPQDLAFTGVMWISDSTFALKRIDAKINKSANLNFIEGIRIQQESIRTPQGYISAKTRILLDIGEIKDSWAGMLAKTYISKKNIKITKPKSNKFYENPKEIAEDAFVDSNEFMNIHRHDSLSKEDIQAYNMVEAVKNVPVIKNTLNIINILYGYHEIGKIGIGPYTTLYSFNNVEGHRLRIGFRTNTKFSKKLVFKGRLAYGTRDKRFKYKLGVKYIARKKSWTLLGASHEYGLKQVALYGDAFLNASNNNLQSNEIFNAITLWGNLDRRRPFMLRESKFYIQSNIFKRFSQKITFQNSEIYPLFPFEYIVPNTDTHKSNILTSQISFESRWAPGEKTLMGRNRRVRLGYGNKPVFIFRYTLGLNDIFGSDLKYQKFLFKIIHRANIGVLGRSFYLLTASYTPDNLPYPLLESHLGNRTPVYNPLGFNTMDYFEFVSDRYVNLNITHYFGGMIANRIPLLRRLKWRFLAVGNILHGSVRKENQEIIPRKDLNNRSISNFNSLGDKPYIEVGYGIENIFKFFRVTAIHRLTYLDLPRAQKFSIKFSAQFKL